MLISNFIFSCNVVLPVFLLLFVGYLLRRDILDPRTTGRLNWIVFNCALPLLLFRDISGSDLSSALDIELISFAAISTLIVFAVIYFLAPKLVKPEEEGAFIQGVFRGNYAIVGLSIMANILGDTQTGKAALVIAILAPLYNILAVFTLTVKSSDRDKSKNALDNIQEAVINIAKNPLILGTLAGIPFSVFHIRLPGFLISSINSLAALASPLALLSIGASITMSRIRNKFKPAVIAAIMKLVVFPLIFVPITVFIGFDREQITILYVMLAAPTAVNSYIMADLMGNDSVLAANIVLLTSLGSLITFTIGIFLLRMINAI